MTIKYHDLEDTVYMWFASNDTSGSGADGSTPAAHVRLAGAVDGAPPVLSPTPYLLTDVNYPAGAYEVAIAATTANGFTTGNEYAVFCTLAVDSQNPTGFIGSFSLDKNIRAETKAFDSVLDLTATMKDSVNAEADTALVDYDAVVSADLPANFADLFITVTTGEVTVGTNNDKSGYSLASTGLDLILSTGTGVVEIAKAVWDRVLTGATHNVPSSAGRRLRSLGSGTYESGAVWVDTNDGVAGTVLYENGVVSNPVATLADALSIATSLNLHGLHVSPDSTITLTAALSGYTVRGSGYSLDLGGQDIGGAVFQDFDVISGVGLNAASDDPEFYIGLFGNVTLPPSRIKLVGMSGTLTVGSVGDFILADCYSDIAGSGSPTIDLGAAIAGTNISIRRWSGGLTLDNMQAGDVVSVDVISGGTITINGTGGDIHVRGMVEVVDGSSGAVSITQTQAINKPSIRNEIVGSATGASKFTDGASSIIQGVAQTGTLSTTQMTTDIPDGADMTERSVMFTGGNLDRTYVRIESSSWTGTQTLVTFSRALSEAPANGDTFIVL